MAKRRRRASRAGKPAPVIRATGFALVDDTGRTLARLGPMPGAGVEDQGVGLVLLRPDGSAGLTVGLDGDGPAVHLSVDGNVRLSFAVLQADDAVLVAARDRRGRDVVSVTVNGAGEASLELSGPT